MARDFVNRVQNLRKDNGLDVQDKIRIILQDNGDLLTSSIIKYKEYICVETQATNIRLVDQLEDGQDLKINGSTLKIKIEV